MNNKGKYIIGLLVIVLAVGLVGAGIFLSMDTKVKDKGKKDNETFYDMPESERLTIKNCKTKVCEMPETDNYDMLVIDKEYEELNKKVEKINKDTKAYYDMVKESTTDNDKCAAVKDLYNHEYRVQTIYYNYEDDKYVSIGVQRNIINLCDNSYERTQVESYLYEKSSKKLLTQAEYKEKEGINNQEMAIAIKNVVNQINQEEALAIDPQAEYIDRVVFYDFQGNILISFFVPEKNLYYTGTVRKVAN